jgi:hypothetical protein
VTEGTGEIAQQNATYNALNAAIAHTGMRNNFATAARRRKPLSYNSTGFRAASRSHFRTRATPQK